MGKNSPQMLTLNCAVLPERKAEDETMNGAPDDEALTDIAGTRPFALRQK